MRIKHTRIRLILVLVCLSLLCQLTPAQKLNAAEQKIITYIDAHIPDAISLIQRSVDIESPTEDLAGVKAVGMLYAKELEAAGLRVKWIDMPADAKRAGHLVAETQG